MITAKRAVEHCKKRQSCCIKKNIEDRTFNMSTNNNVIESPLALSELLGFDVTKCQDSTEAAITTQNKVSQLRAQINATINKECSGFLTDLIRLYNRKTILRIFIMLLILRYMNLLIRINQAFFPKVKMKKLML